MDGDPAVEPQLDSFSLTFPLPYRVGFMVTLAVWGWGLNLHHLHTLKIDVPALIRYPGRTSPHQIPHHFSTYRLATVLSGLFLVSITLFWLLTWRVPSRVVAYDWLPMTYLVGLAAVFFLPLRSLPTTGRRRFLANLRRVSVGGIAEAQDGKFADILLADVLTSYAKVCGDLFVTICMFLSPGGSSTDRPDRNCGGTIVVPLLMAVPSLIRFRQCVTEYLRVNRAPYRESTGWGGQHLANALKYFTACPVLITSSLQRNAQSEAAIAALNKAWLFAVLVNSLYSFYWDVAKDWDLTLFSTRRERKSPYHPWGLRERLFFRPVNLYYGVVALDLMLRCTWSMKLSPHLDKFSNFEGGIFLIEFLELFRRWVWIFFRAETEWIRTTSTGLAVDDILLGDYQGEDEMHRWMNPILYTVVCLILHERGILFGVHMRLTSLIVGAESCFETAPRWVRGNISKRCSKPEYLQSDLRRQLAHMNRRASRSVAMVPIQTQGKVPQARQQNDGFGFDGRGLPARYYRAALEAVLDPPFDPPGDLSSAQSAREMPCLNAMLLSMTIGSHLSIEEDE